MPDTFFPWFPVRDTLGVASLLAQLPLSGAKCRSLLILDVRSPSFLPLYSAKGISFIFLGQSSLLNFTFVYPNAHFTPTLGYLKGTWDLTDLCKTKLMVYTIPCPHPTWCCSFAYLSEWYHPLSYYPSQKCGDHPCTSDSLPIILYPSLVFIQFTS